VRWVKVNTPSNAIDEYAAQTSPALQQSESAAVSAVSVDYSRLYSTRCLKKTTLTLQIELQRTSTDFGSFWQRCCWVSTLRGYLLSDLSQLMSLHYLGKHELRKLGLLRWVIVSYINVVFLRQCMCVCVCNAIHAAVVRHSSSHISSFKRYLTLQYFVYAYASKLILARTARTQCIRVDATCCYTDVHVHIAWLSVSMPSRNAWAML